MCPPGSIPGSWRSDAGTEESTLRDTVREGREVSRKVARVTKSYDTNFAVFELYISRALNYMMLGILLSTKS